MSDGKVNKPGDGAFERELALTSRAYQSVDADTPSPVMDDAIRAAARRAVGSKPRAVGKSWSSRWSAPLSAAALVVLTVSVGFIALDERPELAPAAVTEAVKPSVTYSASPGIPARAPKAPEIAAAETARLPQTTEVAEKKASVNNKAMVAADQLTQSSAPDLDRRRGETSGVSSGAIQAKDTNSNSVVAINSPPAAAPTPAPAAKPMAKEVQAFVADPVVASAAEAAKREQLPEKQTVTQAATASVARADALQAPAAKARAAQTSPAPPAAVGLAASVASREPAAPAPSPSMADRASEPPEAWVKRILELKQQGRTRELEDELSRFRKRYPDFALPAELKAQK